MEEGATKERRIRGRGEETGVRGKPEMGEVTREGQPGKGAGRGKGKGCKGKGREVRGKGGR